MWPKWLEQALVGIEW